MKIQFLIPVFNEERNIERLFEYLHRISIDIDRKTMASNSWSIIFCDNCSSDATLDAINVIGNAYSEHFPISVVAFGLNYGFAFSTSYLLSHAESEVSVLIPADLQVPEIAVFNSIFKAITTNTSSLLCRTETLSAEDKPLKLTRTAKIYFYNVLSTLQGKQAFIGFYGMGCYLSADLSVLKRNRYPDFRPFQVRLVIPKIIYKPNILKFEELPRTEGTSGFGIYRYISEALSILVRTDFIHDNGLKLLLKIICISITFLILSLIGIKIVFNGLILPGFATVIVVTLLGSLINLAGLYMLLLRLERGTQGGITAILFK